MSRHKFRFPKPVEHKQRSTMNAFKHNITGNNMIMQEHECEKYTELSTSLMREFQCATEMERQIAQKIIDTNFRLNRLAGIENNMLNFDMMTRETAGNPDDRTEVMFAQTRAWKDEAKSFDVLGRYEARLTRQLLLYRNELERMQTNRKAAEAIEKESVNPELASIGKTPPPVYVMSAASAEVSVQIIETKPLNPESASFGRNRIEPLPPLPPPIRLKVA